MTVHDVEARALPDRNVAYGPQPEAIRDIMRRFEPLAWVYARLGIEGENERALQARHVSDLLARDGAPNAAAVAVQSRLAHEPVAPVTLALFVASDGTLVHEQRLPGSGTDDRAGYTAPPDVVPLLELDQSRPPFVHVVIDRAGADLTYSVGGDAASDHSVVVGSDDEIERNAPGGRSGRSQSRYQRRAEDSWRHNARQVADELAACAARVGAQALVLSGDVRASRYLEERLPADPALVVRHLSGGRSADGSQAERPARLSDALREVGQTQTAHLLQVFHAHLGPSGQAVQGVDATLAALAGDRVATLLVATDADDRKVWFGADGTDVFADHEAALLAQRPVHAARMIDVAVRAALLSGARVRILPAGGSDRPESGIGALCRFRE